MTERELPISTTIAGVEMRLIAGGVRELHWHPNADEVRAPSASTVADLSSQRLPTTVPSAIQIVVSPQTVPWL